ncbi:hypothetical protein AAES_60341 [Amazona aestiva]|uniref:Uncharacterized protein n=1 Tax=Amazona aestiva TaxID=12930 RepID=A0A0Q3MLK8_AMAAE|nr:hypothetical protein AAES_60341 [Amazona aestiva]
MRLAEAALAVKQIRRLGCSNAKAFVIGSPCSDNRIPNVCLIRGNPVFKNHGTFLCNQSAAAWSTSASRKKIPAASQSVLKEKAHQGLEATKVSIEEKDFTQCKSVQSTLANVPTKLQDKYREKYGELFLDYM